MSVLVPAATGVPAAMVDAPRRALVVDDHDIVVEALKTSVPAMRAFARVDSAHSLAEARRALEADRDCQLAILDLHLVDTDGRDTLEGFRVSFPDVPVLVFSGDASMDIITMAFETGVRGFVTKASPMNVVDAAIRIVLSGGSYVPAEAMHALGLAAPMPAPAEAPRAAAPLPQLSARQEEVFRLLLRGLPNKVIAARLNMAEGTAKAHLNSVFRALGVHSRVGAILRARELGLD